MSFLIDYEFRPGCEYNCYLPRLTGAAAIPTLTTTKFRSACSPNCVHFWKPKPPPPTPPPPPVNPMHVYKYQYLKEKLAPYHIHGPKSRIPTEYDQLMRDVLQIGIPEEDRRRQKRDQDGGKKLTSRVSLILKPEKAHKQDVKGLKLTTSLNRKFDESGTRKNGGWHSEIEQLSNDNANIVKQMQIDEKNHWENVDRQYERINKVIASSTRLTKIYREDLFSLCEKVKANEDRRTANEQRLRLELENIESGNKKLESEILTLRQYPRIGNTRDQLRIIELEKKIEDQKQKTQHELDNPPFVAPEIIMPKFAPLPDTEETEFLRRKEEVARNDLEVLRSDIKERMEINSKHTHEVKVRSKKPDPGLIEIEPNENQNSEIPFLDIPLKRHIII
jgi:hypothetical protein